MASDKNDTILVMDSSGTYEAVKLRRDSFEYKISD